MSALSRRAAVRLFAVLGINETCASVVDCQAARLPVFYRRQARLESFLWEESFILISLPGFNFDGIALLVQQSRGRSGVYRKNKSAVKILSRE